MVKKRNRRKENLSRLLDSLKMFGKGKFWKVAGLELLILVSFMAILSLFALNVMTVESDLVDLSPFAKDTHDLLEGGDIDKATKDIADIKSNMDYMKSKIYAALFKIIYSILLALATIIVISSFFRWIEWSLILDKKIGLKRFGKFVIIDILWIAPAIILIPISLYIFKSPLNFIISGILLLFISHIRLLSHLMYCSGKGFFVSLLDALRHTKNKSALLWRLQTAFVLVALAILSWFSIKTVTGIILLIIILFILYSTWSKFYLNICMRNAEK